MGDELLYEGSDLAATPEVEMGEAVGPDDGLDFDITLVNDEDRPLRLGSSDDEDYCEDNGDSDYRGDGEDEDDAGDEPQSSGDLTAIPRAEWSEETEQTDEMVKLGLTVNTAVRVVVCIGCRSVIKPSDLYNHVVKMHSMSTSAHFCQGLEAKYDLHPDPHNMRPGSIVKAIFSLDLFEGYISCDTCGYACGTKKAMNRHMKQSDECKTFRRRYAQSFRPSSKRMYFGVELESAEDPVATALDPLAYLKEKFTPTPFGNVPITSPKNPRDTDHFLNIEKWLIYVEGKTGAEIRDVTREREPELRTEVRTCVERFAHEAVKKLIGTDNEARAAIGDYIG